MSKKGFQRPWINGFGAKMVTFQVLPNGTSTPTIGDNPDKVLASVSRSDVGVYLMTLNDSFLELRSHSLGLQLATAADSMVQLTEHDVVTAKTLTTTILTAGVAADIAADAGNIIHVTLFLRDSGQ